MGWMPHSWHSKNEDELNSLVIESVPNKQVNKSSAARSFHIVKAKPLCMSAKSARCCPKYSSFIGFYSLWFDWHLMYKKHVQIQRFFWFGAQDPEFFKDFSEYFDLAPLPNSGLYGQMCYVTWCNILVNRILNHRGTWWKILKSHIAMDKWCFYGECGKCFKISKIV